MTPLDAFVAAARWLEAGGGAVLFGAPLLLRLARTPAEDAPWAPRLTVAAAAVLIVGALVALVGQTAGMAGSLGEALAPSTLAGVVSETAFGRGVVVRLVAATAAVLLAGRTTGAAGRVAVAGLGAVALASLAWSGHGAADTGGGGLVHLSSDLLHLLAAGAWLGAMAALLGLVRTAGRAGDGEPLRRASLAFSGVGTAVVAVLLASGLGNSWFLLGPEHWRETATDPWGRLLLLKLALFAAMLGLAALNRWRWTPALALARDGDGRAAARALGRGVAWEAAIGLSALAAAAVMGGLAPPASQA